MRGGLIRPQAANGGDLIMAIRGWPDGERPRDKLLRDGAGALSEAELLAVVLRSGVRGKSAVALARELLVRFGSLRAVMSAANDLRCGDFRLAAAGGMESMSRAPYLLPKARAGLRLGHGEAVARDEDHRTRVLEDHRDFLGTGLLEQGRCPGRCRRKRFLGVPSAVRLAAGVRQWTHGGGKGRLRKDSKKGRERQ